MDNVTYFSSDEKYPWKKTKDLKTELLQMKPWEN